MGRDGMDRRQLASRLIGLAGAGAVSLLQGCAGSDYPVRETVLRPGEYVTATNKFGSIKVSYVSERERRFYFDGRTKTVKLRARPDRFLGKLGLYDPADAWVFAPPPFRLLVEEAERHFKSYDEIYAALYEGGAVMDWVYTSEGLVVGYSKIPPPPDHQVNFDTYEVDFYQFYLDGAKPTGLRGARDAAVRLGHAAPTS
jgi:hypothetical protein